MRFSIIVVCLNPGGKLNQTLDSVLAQTYTDYEVVVKDGGSRDGSIQKMRTGEKIRLYTEKDTGIYDAMNQAVAHAQGEYILFLNCGDLLYSERVLEETNRYIKEAKAASPMILYGDTYSEKNHTLIVSPPRINGFTCYRNIPCHQSCFYAASLCKEKPYEEQYAIRADYDHFLWCYYEAGAKMIHMDQTVSSYEGGGFSENKKNQERNRKEHKEITSRYMSRGELFKYRMLMWCTLAPLRSMLAESKWFSGLYHGLKDRVYHRKKWFLLGILFFCLEMALLVWPVGLAKEDTVHFLAGEGKWLEETVTREAEPEEIVFCQEFVPQYDRLKSVGIYLSLGEEETEEIPEGKVTVWIREKGGESLLEREFPYSVVNFDGYWDVLVNLELDAGKTYELAAACHTEPGEAPPKIGVCGTEYPLKENQALYREEEWEGVQLLTRYHYTDTMPGKKAAGIFLLSLLTMLVICLGLPRNGRVRQCIRILLFLITPLVLGRSLELLSASTIFLQPRALYWNLGIMYLMEITVLLWTGSLRAGVIGTNLFLTILYSVNHYIYLFRGNAFRLNDLMAARTAANVVGEYSLRPDSAMAMVWALFALFAAYALAAGKIRSDKKERKGMSAAFRLLSFATGSFLFAGSFYLFLYTDMLEKAGFQELTGVNQQMTYQFNGYLISSCLDIKNSRMDQLEGYSRERAEEILKEAAGKYAAQNDRPDLPHVILIMNESFSDLRVLGNLQLSQENLENFNGLKENTIRGYVNASVLGGGTANSEFEVFTGCSMGLLPPSYYPYQQCFARPLPSLVSHMEDAGYTTYSMHPETALNYNRITVYDSLGFDHSLWKDDFAGSEKIHYGASDRDTYYKVEEIFQNREAEEKLFIFDLTIQNHGGYTESDVEQTVKSLNAPCDEADNFLSLMKESDEAFGELIAYFEKQDEKVIICMFGDHQPKFVEESFYDNVYRQTAGLTETDKLMNQYKTPFLIWANYDIPEQEDLNISMNYLGVLLQKTAGIPASPYFAFLEELLQEYPVITNNGCLDREGNYYGLDELKDQLQDYRILQYRYLFDKETVEEGY